MIFNNKMELYLELALYLNNDLFENNSISFFEYEKAKEELLKRINACK